MTKKTLNLLVGGVIIIVFVAGYFFIKETYRPQGSFSQKKPQSMETSTSSIKNNALIGSVGSNQMTYSGLGIKFQYLKDAGFGEGYEVRPIEIGNKVTLVMTVNGKEDPDRDNYVIAFGRKENETTIDAIKRNDPSDFKNPNCIITSPSHGNYVIRDKRFSSENPGLSGYEDSHLSVKDICSPVYWMSFTDQGFSKGPLSIYYVSFDTQAVFAFADESHKLQWFQTIQSLKTADND